MWNFQNNSPERLCFVGMNPSIPSYGVTLNLTSGLTHLPSPQAGIQPLGKHWLFYAFAYTR